MLYTIDNFCEVDSDLPIQATKPVVAAMKNVWLIVLQLKQRELSGLEICYKVLRYWA